MRWGTLGEWRPRRPRGTATRRSRTTAQFITRQFPPVGMLLSASAARPALLSKSQSRCSCPASSAAEGESSIRAGGRGKGAAGRTLRRDACGADRRWRENSCSKPSATFEHHQDLFARASLSSNERNPRSRLPYQASREAFLVLVWRLGVGLVFDGLASGNHRRGACWRNSRQRRIWRVQLRDQRRRVGGPDHAGNAGAAHK